MLSNVQCTLQKGPHNLLIWMVQAQNSYARSDLDDHFRSLKSKQNNVKSIRRCGFVLHFSCCANWLCSAGGGAQKSHLKGANSGIEQQLKWIALLVNRVHERQDAFTISRQWSSIGHRKRFESKVRFRSKVKRRGRRFPVEKWNRLWSSHDQKQKQVKPKKWKLANVQWACSSVPYERKRNRNAEANFRSWLVAKKKKRRKTDPKSIMEHVLSVSNEMEIFNLKQFQNACASCLHVARFASQPISGCKVKLKQNWLASDKSQTSSMQSVVWRCP